MSHPFHKYEVQPSLHLKLDLAQNGYVLACLDRRQKSYKGFRANARPTPPRAKFRSPNFRPLSRTEAQVTTYLLKPQTSGSLTKGFFGESDLIDKSDVVEYAFPAGERMINWFTKQQDGLTIHQY